MERKGNKEKKTIKGSEIRKPVSEPRRISRREVLKGLATIPVLGALAYGIHKKRKIEKLLSANISIETGLDYSIPVVEKKVSRDKLIRLGIIGYGIRGTQLMRAAGFAHPEWIEEVRKGNSENPSDKRIEEFLVQDNLNVEITGICDIFDVNAKLALEAASNINRDGPGGKLGKQPKRYKNYKDLITATDVDAVIIATPDHWHGPMIIEAARNKKHVYVEKPMTWTVPETYEVVDIVKQNGIILQLGHQGRQTESYLKAKEVIEKNILGNVSLIEITTNRNDPNGAWVYPIHPDANPKTIDWPQFIGPAPWHDFNLERFFRWRCWWDYSTGLNGDLLTHEYDAINQIMGLGIPSSAVASGGIYFFKDGRTVPDTLQVTYEFPKRNLSMLYSATLSNGIQRGKVFMGHDASMELSNSLIIKAERESTRYKDKIDQGIINPDNPIFTFIPGLKNVDAIASPTQQYFAGRGLLYTYRDGKRVDTTYLHIAEWLDCIRSNTPPSCNIDQGFEEAITAHMATKSLIEGKRICWDEDKKMMYS